MAAQYPIPDRVSPSGPLTSPLNSPLRGMAGVLFNFVDGVNPLTIYPGKIGALDEAVISPTLTMYRSDGVAPSGNAMPLAPLGTPGFGITPGMWVVEANLTVGFNTSPPSQPTNAGALSMEVALINPAGVEILTSGSGSFIQSPIPRSVRVLAAPSETGLQPTHSTKLLASFALSSQVFSGALVNAVPITGLHIRLTRLTCTPADGAIVGDYSATSGILEFARDCSILLRQVG